MSGFALTKPFRDKDITAQVTILDRGVHILLTGGDESHVGAVALAQNGVLVHSYALPEHREGDLANRWAAALSEVYGEATVACGIHYENITKIEIQGVLVVCDALLKKLLS